MMEFSVQKRGSGWTAAHDHAIIALPAGKPVPTPTTKHLPNAFAPPPLDPTMNESTDAAATTTATAILGGGCFWCLDAVFRELKGVTRVESGYAGGANAEPSYEDICTGRTGHAEVVRVTFDPAVLTLRDLLTVFFTIHDPTTRNRQGNDVGTQYRSVIFAQSPEQRATAKEVIASLEQGKLWDAPIVTEVVDAAPFYPAEDYHQDYFEQNAGQPYCMFVVAPKLSKFRKAFADRLR
jgi:peptide-methionine (S)-S-oxide reductase